MGNHSGKESQVPMLPAAKQLHKELDFCMAIKRCGTALYSLPKNLVRICYILVLAIPFNAELALKVT